MGINAYKIKKWFNMMRGKSLLHVEQGLGKLFEPGAVKGYYNDLTNKVLLDPETLNGERLPTMQNEKGERIVFATTIFQYGLGCYDLVLQTGEEKYKKQFEKCIDWAFDNQDDNGGWNISAFAGKKSPYGAMAQGEGTSLLLRAYAYTGDEKYLASAQKAIDLTLLPVSEGGTSLYVGDDLFLMEFTDYPCVLNGWIFALFGLYELSIVNKEEKYRAAFKKSLDTLKAHLKDFDNSYWSKYTIEKAIASPFYHKLHIEQLKALSMIDDDKIFFEYAEKFKRYQSKWLNRKRAFIKKAFQKVFGR